MSASNGKNDSAIRPGYLYLNHYQPSALLSDSLLLDTLLNETEDTIYFKDVESRFILNNRTHLMQFGVETQEQLIGKCDADFYPKAFSDKSRQDELQVMQTGIPLIDSVEQAINAKGEVIMFSTCKYPLYDQNGEIVGTWGISHDITKLVQAQEELDQVNAKLMSLSLLDDLSGLYNRRHFDSMLKITMDLFKRRRIGGLKADFCLILLDIDRFKHINDTYGHVIGDAVIRYLGGQLTAYTRSSDSAFRYGGDEYALILQDTDFSSGKIIGERLRRLIEQNPPIIEGATIHLTISLGIVEFQDEKTNDELVCKADKKLYQAKSEGRNRLCG
jgi:diguanylate cyclase (GGDEF)-like protein/PAS domain S-box-containing protein